MERTLLTGEAFILVRFDGNFTQQEPLSEKAIDAACRVMRSGRLHRYNLLEGERSEVAELEAEYARWQGSRYCLALTSGGQTIQIALRAAGVTPGAKVLTNAFTLAPVPGAIEAVGGQVVLVEIDDNLCLDLGDLATKAEASGARFLLLSHMRGHVCDMNALISVCTAHQLTLIEDCAHTMGAKWAGERSGNFGLAGCFSTQTYKHLNSGEGGLLTSDDPEFMARATILSGSYMLYEHHGARPEPATFAKAKYQMPNCSARMDVLRAAILRVELESLNENIERWNARYRMLEKTLAGCARIALPYRPRMESIVGSSLQFRVPGFDADQCEAFITATARRGVELKWFGRAEPRGFTSAHQSWHYMDPQALPRTDRVLATLFDLRLPLTFSVDDCRLIGQVILKSLEEVYGAIQDVERVENGATGDRV